MNIRPLLYLSLGLYATVLRAGENPRFDTAWIPAKPEVLTYRSTAKQGDGLYQVAVSRTSDGIEACLNIITPGFTKSVWGRMTDAMRPRESKSRIMVRDQITMTTDCSYGQESLHIATAMQPYNQVAERTLSSHDLVVDFAQIPLLLRTLPLQPGAEFKFTSLDPRSNSLVPLRISVVATETMHGTECYKVENHDFEGQSMYWIEQGGHHRVLRIEQPETGRVTEMIQ